MKYLFGGRVRPARGVMPFAQQGAATPGLDPQRAFAGVTERVMAAVHLGAVGREVLLGTVQAIVEKEIAGQTVQLHAGQGGLAGRRLALAQPALTREAVQSWAGQLAAVLRKVCLLATQPAGDGITVSVPLVSLADDPSSFISELLADILRWSVEAHDKPRAGSALATEVKTLLLRVSGLTLEEAASKPQRVKFPDPSETDAVALTKRYLGDTPLAALLLAPIAWKIPFEAMYTSWWICAPPGFGKTQTLGHIIDQLLYHPSHPSLVIIESAGELPEKVGRLKIFALGEKRHGELIRLEPKEMLRPLAMNPMARGMDLGADCPADVRMELEGQVITLMEYLIGGVLGAEFSQQQTVLFR